MNYTHLRQVPSGHLYGYTDALAARPDMHPCNLENGKPTGTPAAEVPVAKHGDMLQLLRRLDALEDETRSTMSSIRAMPGGEDMLKARQSKVPPMPQAVPEQVPLEPPQAAPEPAPDPAADPEVKEAQRDLVVAREAIKSAEKKLAAQKKYLTDRTRVHKEALRVRNEMKAAVETADGSKDRNVRSAELEDAERVLRGASIKLKSAKTKLANAENQLTVAKQDLNELLNPKPD